MYKTVYDLMIISQYYLYSSSDLSEPSAQDFAHNII